MLRGAIARPVAFAEASEPARVADAGSSAAACAAASCVGSRVGSRVVSSIASPPASAVDTYAAAFADTVVEAAAAPRLDSAALRQRPLINRAGISTAMQPQVIRFARQRARHVRLTATFTAEPVDVYAATAADAAFSALAIRTLSVTDSTAPTADLALCKDATASSCAAGTGLNDASAPFNAVDGSPCTYWVPSPGDAGPWIQVDLGEPAFFDQVRVVSPWQPALEATWRPSLRLRVSVSQDAETWTELAAADHDDDPFTALRIELGAALPPCPGGDCEPLHVQVDPATWQVFAVNHTALRVAGAALTALVYDPFGAQLSEIEQRGVTIEPLSVAPGFVVAWPGYFPRTHLLSLRLHDADGALLSESNCWRHQPDRRAHMVR